ncbi:hypothetical protein ACROYT_G017992 [Oculina patagonica]
MAEHKINRTFLLFSFALLCVKYSTGKSVVVDLNLAPEWKREITQRASDYVQHTIVPFVSKELNDLSVPSVSGTIKTPLGNVQYDLNKIKLSNVVIQKSNVSLLPEHGLHITADKASGNIGAEWQYKESSWPHISDSGSCDLSITDLSLGMAFFVDGDLEKEKGKVSAKDCVMKIGSVHVKFKGGASWLYNLFANELASSLKDQLSDQICKTAISLISAKATKALDTFPMIMKKFTAA